MPLWEATDAGSDQEIFDLQFDLSDLGITVVGHAGSCVLRDTVRWQNDSLEIIVSHFCAHLIPLSRKLAVTNELAALVRTEGTMQNHKQDDFDGGRAPSLIEHPRASTDPREKWLAAGANDDLAFLMAMLALAEGAGGAEPSAGQSLSPGEETFHGRAEDAAGAGPSRRET